ncbi:hypothetical protein [Streptomyces koyangensis]|uniref:hypothetical protein n=1 Tax=Streptomyces koyangensis TaxID=188770 RepID=UPI003C2AE062
MDAEDGLKRGTGARLPSVGDRVRVSRVLVDTAEGEAVHVFRGEDPEKAGPSEDAHAVHGEMGRVLIPMVIGHAYQEAARQYLERAAVVRLDVDQARDARALHGVGVLITSVVNAGQVLIMTKTSGVVEVSKLHRTRRSSCLTVTPG